MTRERINELWPAMEAFKAGKALQYRIHAGGWHDLTDGDPEFEDLDMEWRVKLEPREVWINEYPIGLTGVYGSEQEANRNAGSTRIRTIRFVEVVE